MEAELKIAVNKYNQYKSIAKAQTNRGFEAEKLRENYKNRGNLQTNIYRLHISNAIYLI